jgi:propanediol dehydratase small subunit
MNPNPTYPLADDDPNTIQSASGRTLSELTLDAVLSHDLNAADFRIHPETLRRQAEISRQAGIDRLAENLGRASELTSVPNTIILEIYHALRPGRSSYPELTALAEQLEQEYHAPHTASLVRQAAEAYQTRGLLRKPRQRAR